MEKDAHILRQFSADTLRVSKEKLGGFIEYHLLVDEKSALYVKMLDNSREGTFSCRAFKLSTLISDLHDGKSTFVGIDDDGLADRASDKNNKAFLRAVVRQLIPGVI